MSDESLAVRIKKALALDGWSNVLTSIGIKGKDKRLSADVKWERKTRDYFDHFYSGCDIAGNIVDIVPETCLEKGYEISGIEDKGKQKLFMARLRELNLDQKLIEAWKLARIHGGAGLIPVTEDAKMDFPMPSPKMGKKVLAIQVQDRWNLQIQTHEIDAELTSPNFGQPTTYRLQLSEGTRAVDIPLHASRVIQFNGFFLPRQILKNNSYWGDSLLNKLENAIRNYQISHDATALMIQDFDIPVVKLKNLADLVGANDDGQVVKRMELINLCKSIAKMIVLDADKEEFEHKGRNVTGMKDLVDKVENRLVTSSKMPRTLLFGEQAGGMGSTGEHESSNWYDYIEAEQNNYLKPKMLAIVGYIAEAEFGIPRDKIDIVFNPLWQESAKEEAERKKTIAETDQIYINAGVVDPQEVAQSRWGGEKFSAEMQIDETLRDGGAVVPATEGDKEDVKNMTEEAKKKATQEIKG